MKFFAAMLMIFTAAGGAAANGETVELLCEGERTVTVRGDPKVKQSSSPFSIFLDFDKRMVDAPIRLPACAGDFDTYEPCKCWFSPVEIACEGGGRNKKNPNVLWRFAFGLNRHTGAFDGFQQHTGDGNEKDWEYLALYRYQCNVASKKF